MNRAFPPTRAAGLDRLSAFLPRAGRAYADGRNTDPGPDGRPAVSMLSPYLRRRLLTEAEVAGAAWDAHGERAGKFIDEVVWRTYFKGWLEHRPGVWDAYRRDVARGRDRLATEEGLRRRFHDACAGETGIDCFDAWARELAATNWLHNHARMWFASIWIFTLRLPWALGADFFLRHLLDGDPASNTLSWRWVGGLHTRGKHYVARAENIARYTEGRFDPRGDLDEDPAPLEEAGELPRPVRPSGETVPTGDVALLLHTDDLDAATLPLAGARVAALAGFAAPAAVQDGPAAAVRDFDAAALSDALDRAAAHFGVPGRILPPEDVAGWVAEVGLPVVTPYAPVGPNAAILRGLPVRRVLRPWDGLGWPHATKGFFQMRAAIPVLLEEARAAA